MGVTVFGSINLDIALRLPARAAWGETLLVSASAHAVGGKGLNQAIAAARFGAQTAMAGATGDDEAGSKLRAALAEQHVATSTLEILPGIESGRATILLEPDGENMILVEAGANARARADAALPAIGAQTRVLLSQLETDIDETAALFAHEAARPLHKIINLAPAHAQGGRFFDLADTLVFNQSEFAHCLALDREPETLEDLRVVQPRLKPGQSVVVTLGPAGAAVLWADEAHFAPGLTATEVVDTSGAGDCFCGVLAACIDTGIAMAPALRYANAAAALSVGRHGAAPSMPLRREVEALLGE